MTPDTPFDVCSHLLSCSDKAEVPHGPANKPILSAGFEGPFILFILIQRKSTLSTLIKMTASLHSSCKLKLKETYFCPLYRLCFRDVKEHFHERRDIVSWWLQKIWRFQGKGNTFVTAFVLFDCESELVAHGWLGSSQERERLSENQNHGFLFWKMYFNNITEGFKDKKRLFAGAKAAPNSFVCFTVWCYRVKIQSALCSSHCSLPLFCCCSYVIETLAENSIPLF